jgi:protein-S-isoprenylcysteine O-methyltransferase Ste14
MTEKKRSRGYTPFLDFFAVYVITMTFIYIFAITFCTIPKSNIRFADTALGFLLGTVFSWIINWAFRTAKAQIDKQSAEHEVKINGGKDETS